MGKLVIWIIGLTLLYYFLLIAYDLFIKNIPVNKDEESIVFSDEDEYENEEVVDVESLNEIKKMEDLDVINHDIEELEIPSNEGVSLDKFLMMAKSKSKAALENIEFE